jgi:hypothetical protein
VSQALLLSERWRVGVPRLTFFPAIEAGAGFLLLVLFSNALIAPLLSDPADPDGGAALRLLWPPVYLASVMLIALSPARVWRTALRAWPVVVLAGLTVISTTWSLDPALTLRRSVAVMMTAVFGLWLAARFSWPDLLRLSFLKAPVWSLRTAKSAVNGNRWLRNETIRLQNPVKDSCMRDA